MFLGDASVLKPTIMPAVPEISERIRKGKLYETTFTGMNQRSYGVTVSTLDSESSDPSSNLGRTSSFFLR